MTQILDKSAILDALRRVKGPDLEGNIVDLNLVSEVVIANGKVYFSITVPPERAEELEPLRAAAEQVVKELDGVESVNAVLTAERPSGAAAAPQTARAANGSGTPQARPSGAPGGQAGSAGRGGAARPGQHDLGHKGVGVPGIKHIIAVASGKGGVGKSTTAVNLALGLQANGLKVGILDADIYGPSMPRLLGLTGHPEADEETNTLIAMDGFGLKVMSMGFLVGEDTPVVWRGPMVMSALTQMLREVQWGELDVLVIDMPPGTGDAQITMAQQVPLAGAVIISTPQDLALIDARKGLNMFRQVKVPVLGLIENMSYFICPSCGERSDIFGHGGAEREAEKLGIPFLGAVPLHMAIRETSDAGRPVVASDPEGPHAKAYREIAAATWAQIEAQGAGTRQAPKIVVE